MSSPIPLPRHIIAIIASALHPQDDRHTLVALRIASKDGYAAAVPILYSAVDISSHGIDGLLGIKPLNDTAGVVHLPELDAVAEAGDLGCQVFDAAGLEEDVRKAKASNSFLLKENASLRRFYHLRYMRQLGVELGLDHPFLRMIFLYEPPAPSDRGSADGEPAATVEVDETPFREPLLPGILPHVTRVSFKEGRKPPLPDRDPDYRIASIAKLTGASLRHLCTPSSSLSSTFRFERMTSTFDIEHATDSGPDPRTFIFHRMDHWAAPPVANIPHIACRYRIQINTRHPPPLPLQEDGFALFKPDTGSYTRSGKMTRTFVKNWENQIEGITGWIKNSPHRKIDVVYDIELIDPRGQTYPMRKTDQEFMKEHLDQFLYRKLGFLDTAEVKCSNRVTSRLRGDLQCEACGKDV